ncbi:MAG: Txe/YoeB family addiction module toxin [Rikenellaceae bacterium]
MYTLILSDKAKEDITKLKRNDLNSFKKISKLLIELTLHPREGTGQVEVLRYFEEETYSRRISQKHRLVYRVYDNVVEVLVLSAYGHYDDK